MANLNFPSTTGQPTDGSFQFVANNGVTYTWDGDKWEANTSSSLNAMYVQVAGDNMTGNLTLGTDKITLKTDGNITAVQEVIAGRLRVDGSLATIGDWYSLVQSRDGDIIGGWTNTDNSFKVGGTLPSAPNITLNANGSAEFAGGNFNIASNGFASSERLHSGDSFSTVLEINSSVGKAYLRGFVTGDGFDSFSITQNGSADFKGNLIVGGSPTGAANNGCRLYPEGSFQVSGQASNAVVWNAYITGNNTSTSKILADGSAEFAGSATFGGGPPNTDVRDQAVRIASDGRIQLRNDTDIDVLNIFKGGNTGVDRSIILSSNGSATFKGAVKTQGGVVSPSMVLELEADDDTKYTTTTDADGNETRVYNGATLDVKDRLTKTDAALQSLKAALVTTTDHASLKAALIAALADI